VLCSAKAYSVLILAPTIRVRQAEGISATSTRALLLEYTP